MKTIETKNKHEEPVAMEDLYSLNVGKMWSAFKMQSLAFWALCGYFFFEYVRPQNLYPVIDVLPWALTFLLIALFASFSDKTVQWTGNPENKLMVVFTLIVIVSGIFAFQPEYSFAKRDVFLTWILVYFLVVNVINTEARLYLFIVLYLVFNFKMSQHGFVTWAERGFSFASHGLIGAPGWFRNSGEFSMQMLIVLSLSLAFVMSIRTKISGLRKYVFYFIPFTAFATILGASSRGSQLALAVLAVWLLTKSKHWFRASLVIGILALLAWHFLPAEQIARFQEVGTDNTSLQRMAYWDIGLKIVNDHPIIGIGYYNWVPYLRYLYPEGVGPLQTVEAAHNSLLEGVTELGYAGFGVFILMVFYIFKLNRDARRMAKEANKDFLYYVPYGLDAGLVSYLISGFFIAAFYYPFFWVQLAMTVAVYNVALKEHGVHQHKRIMKLD